MLDGVKPALLRMDMESGSNKSERTGRTTEAAAGEGVGTGTGPAAEGAALRRLLRLAADSMAVASVAKGNPSLAFRGKVGIRWASLSSSSTQTTSGCGRGWGARTDPSAAVAADREFEGKCDDWSGEVKPCAVAKSRAADVDVDVVWPWSGWACGEGASLLSLVMSCASSELEGNDSTPRSSSLRSWSEAG